MMSRSISEALSNELKQVFIEFKIGLYPMRSYLRDMEHHLEQLTQKIETQKIDFDKWAKTIPIGESVPCNPYDEYADLVNYDYLEILRESFFLSLYTLYETKDKDLKSYFDISAFKKERNRYYKKIHCCYRHLRNHLAHNRGKASTRLDNKDWENGRQKLIEYIDSDDCQHLKLSSDGNYIIVTSDFCQEALDVIENYFRDILFDSPWCKEPYR